jgi:hypothetical protein
MSTLIYTIAMWLTGVLGQKVPNTSYLRAAYPKVSCFIDINWMLGDDSAHLSGKCAGQDLSWCECWPLPKGDIFIAASK